MDYVKLYREYARNSEILLANDARAVLPYAQDVIACDIHTRARTVRLSKEAGARTALTLADLLNAPVDGSGYNPDFGTVRLEPGDGKLRQAFPARLREVRREAGRHAAR